MRVLTLDLARALGRLPLGETTVGLPPVPKLAFPGAETPSPEDSALEFLAASGLAGTDGPEPFSPSGS
jgi:hypothetical protein